MVLFRILLRDVLKKHMYSFLKFVHRINRGGVIAIEECKQKIYIFMVDRINRNTGDGIYGIRFGCVDLFKDRQSNTNGDLCLLRGIACSDPVTCDRAYRR